MSNYWNLQRLPNQYESTNTGWT